jgi:rSAM/selenodomain-associated transferase 1
MSGVRVLVFGRAPVPGTTKTRLIPHLGEQGAARLARAMLEHTMAAAAAARPLALELWHAGEADETLGELARRFGVVLRRQPDGDLGQRMRHALAMATAAGEPAMLVGSDCPLLIGADIGGAMTALASHHAVLAPATDGGYVLLGAHSAPERLFEGIGWGGSDVAAQTRARFGELGWTWLELPARADVDRPDDLVTLARYDPAWRGWAEAGGAV